MLQQFAAQLCKLDPNCSVNLDCFEEGYMAVQVAKGVSQIAEVQIVQRNAEDEKRSYGLFWDTAELDELYFDDLELLLSVVAEHLRETE